jgi:glycosyltransferase involved in cell wall biosynthesis
VTGRRISVVMPAYGVEAFVAESVASIHAQTWPEIELIAVDDGGTDGTGALLDRLAEGWEEPGRRMVVLHRENGGAGAARNAGLAAATGDIFAFADADDVCHPELFARSVALLDADPALAMTFPLCRYVDEGGVVVGVRKPERRDRFSFRDLVVANPIHTGTGVVARRAAVEAAGRFDTSLKGCIDIDFWIRVAGTEPGAVGCVQTPLVDYRKRQGQITQDWRRMRDNSAIVRSKLARRGITLSRKERRRMAASTRLYWAVLAYQDGDYRSARRLALTGMAADPIYILGDSRYHLRLAGCAATLLPFGLHEKLQRWYLTRQTE